jgi:hypothetical protein
VFTGKLALVETTPEEETTTSAEFGRFAVSTYVTAPLPAATSWLPKAANVDVVAVPAVGADWVIVTAVTLSVKVHVPVLKPVSKSVPLTA